MRQTAPTILAGLDVGCQSIRQQCRVNLIFVFTVGCRIEAYLPAFEVSRADFQHVAGQAVQEILSSGHFSAAEFTWAIFLAMSASNFWYSLLSTLKRLNM